MFVIPIKLDFPIYNIGSYACYHIPSKTWYLERLGYPDQERTKLDVHVEPTKFSVFRKVKEVIKKQPKWKHQRLEVGTGTYYYAICDGYRISLGNRLIARGEDAMLASLKTPTIKFADEHFLEKGTEHVWLGASSNPRPNLGKQPAVSMSMMVSLATWYLWVRRPGQEFSTTLCAKVKHAKQSPLSRVIGGEFTYAFKTLDGSIIAAETHIRYYGLWSGEREECFCGDKPNSNGYHFKTRWRYLCPDTQAYFYDSTMRTFWTTEGTDFGIYKTGGYLETRMFRDELLRHIVQGYAPFEKLY